MNVLAKVAPLVTSALTWLTAWMIRREKLATVAVALFFFPILPIWVSLDFASVPMAILQFAGVDIGTTGLVGQIVSAVMFPISLAAMIRWLLWKRESMPAAEASDE